MDCLTSLACALSGSLKGQSECGPMSVDISSPTSSASEPTSSFPAELSRAASALEVEATHPPISKYPDVVPVPIMWRQDADEPFTDSQSDLDLRAFARLRLDKTTGFIHRDWLSAILQYALTQEGKTCILITGDPGYGKTCIALQLILLGFPHKPFTDLATRYCVPNINVPVFGFHMCSLRNVLQSGDSLEMVANFHQQLKASIKDFKGCSSYKNQKSPADAFRALLQSLARIKWPPRCGLFVVDGLDEVAQVYTLIFSIVY
jgi:hypothetical protein